MSCIEHAIAISLRSVIEHKPLHIVCTCQNVPVLVGIFCVGNYRDILFTSRDIGYLKKIVKGIFSNLLKGIWDTFLFTSRDIGFSPTYRSRQAVP